jgi:hypothetical protein
MLGGIRKLTTGTWWVEYESDTIVRVKDTANVTVITRDTIEHHKRSEVGNVIVVNGTYQYQVQTFDTVLPVTTGPTLGGITILHSATEVGYTAAPIGFGDSIRVKAYDLPLATGKSWQTFSATADTSMQVPFGPISIRLHADYSFSGQAHVPATIAYEFGNVSRPCFEILDTTLTDAAIVSDTTIVLQLGLLTDTVVRQDDTIATSRTVETNLQYVNTDLSISLWSYDVQAKCDSNHINNVVERDTTRKATHVAAYLDARVIQ